MSAMTATSDATSIRNDDECHHKQTFYISPITLQSMDTFTVGRERLSLSYVMAGIEKSCLRISIRFLLHSQPDETVKIGNIFHNVGNMWSRKVLLQHSSLFST